MWEQARQVQEATILRPSSENIGLDSSSVTHPVAMTATPPKDSEHHQIDTDHGQVEVSSFHFQASSLPNHLAFGVYWGCRAGKLLLVRRWRRRSVHALARRILHVGDVPVMVFGNPVFGEKGRLRAEETAPIGFAGTPTRKRRTSVQAKETGYGTERPNRSVPSQRGVDSRLGALMRETDRNRIGTEQSEFQETPIAVDERGHLHDSDGSKNVEDNSHRFGILEGKDDSPNPVSNVGTRRRMALARG